MAIAEQVKLFDAKHKEKRGKQKPKFEAVIDGFGVETIPETKEPHECFACLLPIPPGSKAEKRTPVIDGKPLWYQSIYKHKPACPPIEDEPNL